jgi:PASTA domain
VLVAMAMGLIVGAIGPASASAEPGGGSLPTYEGDLAFPAIKSAADPEDFSWQVRLDPGQTLKLVDEHEAEVENKSHVIALTITTEKAHDASGANVPTMFEVAEEDVLTLVVHHREGFYAYPVTAGEGWIGSGETTIVKGPPDEKEIAEARRQAEEARQIEEADRAGAASPLGLTPSFTCAVPALRGLSLAAAKARLRAAHCTIGQVRLAARATAGKSKVVKQFHAAGTELAAGAPVAVKLGSR